MFPEVVHGVKNLLILSFMLTICCLISPKNSHFCPVFSLFQPTFPTFLPTFPQTLLLSLNSAVCHPHSALRTSFRLRLRLRRHPPGSARVVSLLRRNSPLLRSA